MIAKHGIRGVEADRLIAYIHLNVEHPIQGDGWWYAADTNGSLDDWINRYRTAATKTTAAAGTAVAENTPCLLHSRQPAGNCGACWADVLGGCDPYQGRDDERPANFWTIYNRQNRTSQRGESAEATKAAGWLALGTDEQTRWDHNQRIIDHQSEATR